MRSLIDRIPAIVYTAELGINGRWRFVSSQIEEILGYTPEEWMAEPNMWASHLHPDDREYAFSFETEAWLETRTAPPAEYRILTREGEVVWVLEEAKLVRDADGVPIWHGVMYDITRRKLVEMNMEALAEQQAAIAEIGRRGLEGDDPDSLFEAAFEQLLRSDAVELVSIWECREDGGPARLRRALGSVGAPLTPGTLAGNGTYIAHVIESKSPIAIGDWRTEARLQLPSLTTAVELRSTAAVLIDGTERPFGVLDVHSSRAEAFSVREVTFLQSAANILASGIERRRTDQRLRHRALHDSLTGLPNRELFVEVLNAALQRTTSRREAVAVLFIDLDNFKLINDGLGHQAGDRLLRQVAPRLAARLRSGDTIARFGGDEFAIVLEGIENEDEAVEVAGRLESELTKPIELNGVENFVTASIGIAISRPGSAGPVDAQAEALVRDADAAMYVAKARGRAGHAIFDDAMRDTAMRRLEVLRDLHGAVERRELLLHYQPIVSLADGRIEGFEALIRWEHPRLGMLAPAEFIPAAEGTDLIEPVGAWVIEQACLQAAEWAELFPKAADIGISVNIAARQITHHDLCDSVSEVLAATGLDPSRLQLEITEGVLLDEPVTIAETLESLSHLGVRIVLDDFGTGYSSLAYLDRFHLDALKVDRSFASRLERGERGVVIVEAIVAMARALSLVTVAEGVETAEQASQLERLGCDQGQGYLYSRPLTAEAATEMLAVGTPVFDRLR